jgi:hypothetical protein
VPGGVTDTVSTNNSDQESTTVEVDLIFEDGFES